MSYYKADPGLLTAMSSAISYEFDRGIVDYKSANYQGRRLIVGKN